MGRWLVDTGQLIAFLVGSLSSLIGGFFLALKSGWLATRQEVTGIERGYTVALAAKEQTITLLTMLAERATDTTGKAIDLAEKK
jgi:hypothetical protein